MKLITKLVATAICAALVVPAFVSPANATVKKSGKMAAGHKMGGKMKSHKMAGKMGGKMGKMASHKMGGKKPGKMTGKKPTM